MKVNLTGIAFGFHLTPQWRRFKGHLTYTLGFSFQHGEQMERKDGGGCGGRQNVTLGLIETDDLGSQVCVCVMLDAGGCKTNKCALTRSVPLVWERDLFPAGRLSRRTSRYPYRLASASLNRFAQPDWSVFDKHLSGVNASKSARFS